MLCAVCWQLVVVCRLPFVSCCLLCAVSCVSFALLVVVRCLLRAVCNLLNAGCVLSCVIRWRCVSIVV